MIIIITINNWYNYNYLFFLLFETCNVCNNNNTLSRSLESRGVSESNYNNNCYYYYYHYYNDTNNNNNNNNSKNTNKKPNL